MDESESHNELLATYFLLPTSWDKGKMEIPIPNFRVLTYYSYYYYSCHDMCDLLNNDLLQFYS